MVTFAALYRGNSAAHASLLGVCVEHHAIAQLARTMLDGLECEKQEDALNILANGSRDASKECCLPDSDVVTDTIRQAQIKALHHLLEEVSG